MLYAKYILVTERVVEIKIVGFSNLLMMMAMAQIYEKINQI